MVLWEIALVTAWFLGLKRTHKLSLTLQRKLISPKHPKLRDFVQSRTRRVFDVAVGVHLKLQQRKVEIGKNIGNWIIWGKKPLAATTITGPRLVTSSNTASGIKKLMNDSADKVRVATSSNAASSIKKLMNDSADKVRVATSSTTASSIKKLMNNSVDNVGFQNLRGKSNQLFTVARNMWPKTTFPAVTMNKIMGPMRTAGSIVQNRQYIRGGTGDFTVGYGKFGFGDVVRNDIRQYLMCP